jgi:hypothetical protein
MNQEADISDYSLEFAHVALIGKDFNRSEVTKSADIALKELQRIEKKGLTCAVCILIDDKHVKSTLTYKDITPFLQFVSQHFPRIDYVCFEKSLPKHKDKIFEQLDPDKRDHIAGEFWRYQRKHKKLACSHDIAIWHMIRLGLINDIEAGTIVPVGAVGTSAHAPSFVARNLISILSAHDKPFEEKASKEILRHCVDKKAVSRIQRIYYK